MKTRPKPMLLYSMETPSGSVSIEVHDVGLVGIIRKQNSPFRLTAEMFSIDPSRVWEYKHAKPDRNTIDYTRNYLGRIIRESGKYSRRILF